LTLVTGAMVAWASTVEARGPRDEPSEDKPTPPVDPTRGEVERFSVHFQTTVATQFHPKFNAKYSGPNSLRPEAESATATLSTLYLDARLWPGAELLINPEMSGGRGLSGTLGVAGFPNGIAMRVGDPAPTLYFARMAISQTFNLGGGRVTNLPGPNELAGTRDRDVLALTVGRLSVMDVFDGNRYAHDPTERFFNWALYGSGAWDYPADARGYTYGALASLAVDWWSVRAGISLLPKDANGSDMEWRIDKSRAVMAEYEVRYAVGDRVGAASLLFFHNTAPMGSYRGVLEYPGVYGKDLTATRAPGRTKMGFAFSVEQELTPSTGAFLRMSANDGTNESWAFTEIDRSLALGVVQKGTLWQRPRDEAGAAFVLNGLSFLHRSFLEAGGNGFILGDGGLRYGTEAIGDVYYKARLSDEVSVSALYQPIVNPGFNQDRGPVHVLSGRFHVAF
jgi:high affinity Mn2+ porin